MSSDAIFLISTGLIIVSLLVVLFSKYSYLLEGQINGRLALLIDIGNGTITSGLVLFGKNNLPRFLYGMNTPFVVKDKVSAAELFSSMKTVLDSVVATTIKQVSNNQPLKNRNIENTLISFSSPWFITKTKDVHISEEKPFLVDGSFLGNISKKEEELFKQELSAEVDGNKKNSFSVIEKNIIHTKINGYSVDRSLGQKTKDFNASVFLSAIDKDVVEKVIDIISNHTHISREKILIHTFPLILFSTIRDNFSPEPDFILMDITSEVTDITLVTDDVVTKTGSFPFGRNFILRQIAKTFNCSETVAESMLHIYMDGSVNNQNYLPMQNLVGGLEKEWAIYFEDVLSTLSPDMALPKNIYITADSDVTPIFVDFLKLPKVDATANFRKNLNIININKEVLSRFYESDSKKQEDVFITLLLIFYNKLLFL